MTEYVSCDLGSSFAKASDGERQVRFPSILVRGRPGNGICVAGSWHIAGLDAIDAQPNPVTDPHAIAKYHGSASQLILLCEALRRLGHGHDRPLDLLMLGLPYGLHKDPEIVARVEDMCRLLSWQQGPGQAERHVQPAQVRIVPQGFGTLRLFAQQHPALVRPGNLVAVADIGGQTTDVMMMELEESGAPRLIGGCSSAIGINVLGLYRMLVDDLRDPSRNAHVLKRSYHFHDLMERVRHGRLVLSEGPGGAQQDIAPNVERVRRAWTERLQAGVRGVMGSRWSDLSAMVLTGGGAALVDHDVWEGPVCTMGDMANVEGQILVMQQQGG